MTVGQSIDPSCCVSLCEMVRLNNINIHLNSDWFILVRNRGLKCKYYISALHDVLFVWETFKWLRLLVVYSVYNISITLSFHDVTKVNLNANGFIWFTKFEKFVKPS